MSITRTVRYWQPIILMHPHLKNDSDLTNLINDLENGRYHQIKEIDDNLFRDEYNRPGRVLFTTFTFNGKHYIYLLEKLPTHDYKKSKYLKDGVLKRHMENHQDAIVQQLENKLSLVPSSTASSSSSSSSVSSTDKPQYDFRFNDHCHYFNGELILLDDIQQSVIQAKSPVVPSGSAGTGKTILVLIVAKKAARYAFNEGLSTKDEYYIPTLVYKSKDLVEHIKTYIQSEGDFDLVNVTTYRDLALKQNPGKKELLQLKFEEWINKNIVQLNKKHSLQLKFHQVKDEFDTSCALTKDGYLDLGDRHSHFKRNEENHIRKIIFQLYTEFQTKLESERLIFPDYTPLLKKFCHTLISDEAQRFNALQSKSLLYGGEIVYFFQGHFQKIDGFSLKIEYFFKAIESDMKKKISPISLKFDYRSPQIPSRIQSQLAKLPYLLIDQPVQHLESRNPEMGFAQWINPSDAAKNVIITELLAKYPFDTVVIVLDEDARTKAKEDFPDTKMILTVEEAQGREYLYTINYYYFSGAKEKSYLLECNKKLKSTDIVQAEKKVNRSTDRSVKPNPLWDIYSVGCTRTKFGEFFYQPAEKGMEYLFEYMLPEIKIQNEVNLDLLTHKTTSSETIKKIVQHYILEEQLPQAEYLHSEWKSREGFSPEEIKKQFDLLLTETYAKTEKSISNIVIEEEKINPVSVSTSSPVKPTPTNPPKNSKPSSANVRALRYTPEELLGVRYLEDKFKNNSGFSVGVLKNIFNQKPLETMLKYLTKLEFTYNGKTKTFLDHLTEQDITLFIATLFEEDKNKKWYAEKVVTCLYSLESKYYSNLVNTRAIFKSDALTDYRKLKLEEKYLERLREFLLPHFPVIFKKAIELSIDIVSENPFVYENVIDHLSSNQFCEYVQFFLKTKTNTPNINDIRLSKHEHYFMFKLFDWLTAGNARSNELLNQIATLPSDHIQILFLVDFVNRYENKSTVYQFFGHLMYHENKKLKNAFVNAVAQMKPIQNEHDQEEQKYADTKLNFIGTLLGIMFQTDINLHTEDVQDKLIDLSISKFAPFFSNPSSNSVLKKVLELAVKSRGKQILVPFFKYFPDLDPNITIPDDDSDEVPLIHMASIQCRSTVIEFLLKKNPILNGSNFKGITPFHYAIENHYSNIDVTELFPIFELLMKADPTLVNKENEDGETPFTFALSYNEHKIIQFLLDHNVNINHVNSHQATPLMFAIDHASCSEDTINFLLNNGAQFYIPDDIEKRIDRKNQIHILMDKLEKFKNKRDRIQRLTKLLDCDIFPKDEIQSMFNQFKNKDGSIAHVDQEKNDFVFIFKYKNASSNFLHHLCIMHNNAFLEFLMEEMENNSSFMDLMIDLRFDRRQFTLKPDPEQKSLNENSSRDDSNLVSIIYILFSHGFMKNKSHVINNKKISDYTLEHLSADSNEKQSNPFASLIACCSLCIENKNSLCAQAYFSKIFALMIHLARCDANGSTQLLTFGNNKLLPELNKNKDYFSIFFFHACFEYENKFQSFAEHMLELKDSDMQNNLFALLHVITTSQSDPHGMHLFNMLKVFMQKAKGVHTEFNFKRTALFFAIQIQSPFLMQTFLKYDANVNHPDQAGVTPLILAAMTGNDAIIQCIQNKNPHCIDPEKIDVLKWIKSARETYDKSASPYNNFHHIDNVLLGSDYLILHKNPAHPKPVESSLMAINGSLLNAVFQRVCHVDANQNEFKALIQLMKLILKNLNQPCSVMENVVADWKKVNVEFFKSADANLLDNPMAGKNKMETWVDSVIKNLRPVFAPDVKEKKGPGITH